jgi:hypothetical protein
MHGPPAALRPRSVPAATAHWAGRGGARWGRARCLRGWAGPGRGGAGRGPGPFQPAARCAPNGKAGPGHRDPVGPTGPAGLAAGEARSDSCALAARGLQPGSLRGASAGCLLFVPCLSSSFSCRLLFVLFLSCSRARIDSDQVARPSSISMPVRAAVGPTCPTPVQARVSFSLGTRRVGLQSVDTLIISAARHPPPMILQRMRQRRAPCLGLLCDFHIYR